MPYTGFHGVLPLSLAWWIGWSGMDWNWTDPTASGQIGHDWTVWDLSNNIKHIIKYGHGLKRSSMMCHWDVPLGCPMPLSLPCMAWRVCTTHTLESASWSVAGRSSAARRPRTRSSGLFRLAVMVALGLIRPDSILTVWPTSHYYAWINKSDT